MQTDQPTTTQLHETAPGAEARRRPAVGRWLTRPTLASLLLAVLALGIWIAIFVSSMSTIP